jgi:asparagine synthase (glutamine-hydrolysing)
VCGICGVIQQETSRPVDPAMLGRMTESLVHRGPDGSGFFQAPGVGLGIRRLTIIDLETGDQPISNEDGSVTIVCNGEIYNYLELRQTLLAAGHCFRTASDVEVIAHLYEDYGVECLRHLRGMFGFALWDGRRQHCLLARDRVGIKPLYYAACHDALYFGSELKAILATQCVEKQVDLGAFKDLMTLGYVISPKTMFARIRRLPAGYYMVYRGGRVSLHQYWDVDFPAATGQPDGMSENDWAEGLLEKLQETVKIHLRSDVPVGAWLSGGLDSSGIVSLMRPFCSDQFDTFSLGFADREADELRRHALLNTFAGYSVRNHQTVCQPDDFRLLPMALWHCEHLSASGIEIPRMILARFASQSVKVVLTGEGADEIFAGYYWFLLDKWLRPLSRLPLAMRRMLLLGSLLPRRFPRASQILLAPYCMNLERYKQLAGLTQHGISDQLWSNGLKPLIDRIEKGEDELKLPEAFGGWHPLNQLQYYTMKIRLPDFINHKLDQTSMAFGLEARVPFLDHELVEFCARIPPALKLHGSCEKYILRRALRGFLPKPILRRKKFGLWAPFGPWLRDSAPEFVREMLSPDSLQKKGYFSPSAVHAMLQRHQSCRADFGRHLLGILAIQLWDELFLRGNMDLVKT